MSNAEKLEKSYESGSVEKFTQCLADGADPNIELNDGYTYLMLCAGMGQIDMAKALIEAGADVNLVNSSGSSALKMSCLKSDLAMTKVLLDAKAEPNLFDSQGFTPLMYSAMNQNVEICDLLMKHGADPKSESKSRGHSSIDFAKRSGAEDLLKVLEGKKLSAKQQREKIDPNKLVGQSEAKDLLSNIISMSKVNLEREKRELPPLEVTLHAIFTGNPGTGKTTFARYYAQEIEALGVLPKGHLVEVSRSDLVAEYVGQTPAKTTQVFRSALGGILFVDEAYSLKSGKEDQFGQEAIDTLIKLIEDHRKEIIVILAGYKDEMREFMHTNTGLKSRIPNIIEFVDYTNEELDAIFKIMLENLGLAVTDDDRLVALEQVWQERKGRSFGNARVVRNIIDRALRQQSSRLSRKDLSKMSKEELCALIYSDFTEDPADEGTFEEIVESSGAREELDGMEQLNALVGLNNIKNEIRGLANYIRVTKARTGASTPDIGMHMVFKGNPGTGKTTVARLLAKIFKDLGFLANGHLVEADRSRLVAPYVGQTAIKTREVVEDALGGVLFIDEAYSLFRGDGGRDSFGQEAVDTLLKLAEDYRKQIIIILAGYPREMSLFLSSNPGLDSRFNRKFDFLDYDDNQLVDIAEIMVTEQGFTLTEDAKSKIKELIKAEREAKMHFGNARTVRNILENSYRNQATRILKLGDPDALDDSVLESIETEDIKL